MSLLQPGVGQLVLVAGKLPPLGGALCVEGLRGLQAVWELLFSTKQGFTKQRKIP